MINGGGLKMLIGFVLSFIALAIYETNPLISWVLIGVLFLHTYSYTKIIERWSRNEKRKKAPLSINHRRNRE